MNQTQSNQLPATDVARAPGSTPERAAAGRSRRPRRFTLDPRGQGLVEFAISFPVVMLMILFGIDFGRVFMGWVTLTNAVREAANYAAINPQAWDTPGSPSSRAEYARLINAEADEINCSMPSVIPDPTFPSGTDLGSPAVVAITCEFSLITPLMGNLLGNPLDVSASAAFPIRGGAIDGTPIGGTLPTFNPVPTAAPTDTPAPTASAIPTPSPVITPVPMCTVPDLVTGTLRTNQATHQWTLAGFTANNLLFNPLVPPHYDIRSQNLPIASSVACTSSMTVSSTVAP